MDFVLRNLARNERQPRAATFVFHKFPNFNDNKTDKKMLKNSLERMFKGLKICKKGYIIMFKI